MSQKLPFTIDFVVEQNLVPLGIKKHKAARGYSFNCPFCQNKLSKPDTKHKYTIDLTKNVGHCMRCGEGHGIISLHQALTGIKDQKEALNDLYRRWNGLGSDVKVKLEQIASAQEELYKDTLIPAPIRIRDRAYRNLLNQLSLSKEHREDLLKRGLSEDEIAQGMYKSVPVIGIHTFARNSIDNDLKKFFYRHPQYGIPGFVNVADDPSIISLKSGYFIPVKDINGLISGMQIRFDNPKDDASDYELEHYCKYKWFSSSFDKDGCGCNRIESFHYSGSFDNCRNILLTEGVLKSDIASLLYQKLKHTDKAVPVIGLVGVSNYSKLDLELVTLKATRNLNKVWIAIDMDYLDKPSVASSLEMIKKQCKKALVDYEMFTWDPSRGKGIDDYLLDLCKKRNILPL